MAGDVKLAYPGYDSNFLRRIRSGGWYNFMHGSNKDAIRLHAEGWLERRHWDRPEGGYQYRISDAGRAALTRSQP
jgi:hypothetical protein